MYAFSWLAIVRVLLLLACSSCPFLLSAARIPEPGPVGCVLPPLRRCIRRSAVQKLPRHDCGRGGCTLIQSIQVSVESELRRAAQDVDDQPPGPWALLGAAPDSQWPRLAERQRWLSFVAVWVGAAPGVLRGDIARGPRQCVAVESTKGGLQAARGLAEANRVFSGSS